jgi:hypothetical protein
LTSYASAFSLRASSGGFWGRGDAAEAQALLESLLPRAEKILGAQILTPVLGQVAFFPWRFEDDEDEPVAVEVAG